MADGIFKFLNNRENFYRDRLEFYFKIVAENSYYLSIPEDFKITSPGFDDDDYKIVTNNDWVKNGILPDEFIKYNKDDEEGKLITFSELTSWAKWIILSYDLGFGPVGRSGAVPDDEDYRLLVDYKILNTIKLRINSSDKKFISKRLEANFKKFLKEIKSDQGNLSDEKIKFFKEYSTFCTNNEIVGELRIEITKKTGSSDFIAENFGITKRFDFETFSDTTQMIIRRKIDGVTNYTNGKPVVKATRDSSGWYFAKNSTEKIKYSITVSENFPDLHNKIRGTSRSNEYSVPSAELKTSDVYQNAVSYDVIEGWDKGTPFYELGTKFQTYEGSFQDLYNPTIEVIDWFPDKKIATGPDDVVFVYFLKFIYQIKLDIEDTNQLTETLGTVFDNLAEQAADYILPRVVRVFEQNVRISIADFLSKQTDEKPLNEEQQQKDALDSAYESAKQSLSEIQLSDIKKEDLSEEDISNREKKYKQCVLMMNIPTLSKNYRQEVMNKFNNKDSMHSDGIYNQRFTMVSDGQLSNQNLIVNKLLVPKADKIESFLNMTPELYAALQPKIRLHKVYHDPSESETNRNIVREIPFRSSTDTGRVSLLSKGNTFDKGDGVGIKSFNFSFDGETPATSTKFIQAKLELFFQTFADFVKERTVTNEQGTYSFRYVDLFVNTKFCPRSGANEGANVNSPLYYDPNHYRIRADIGYEIPKDINSILNRPGVVAGGEAKIGEIQEAIRVVNKSFYLNLIDHDINIAEDGTVSISADYIAYIEGATGTKIMNALNSKEARKFEEDQIKTYEDAVRNNKCNKKQLSELRASIQGARTIAKQKMYQSLTEKLILNGCLYSCFIDKFSRKKFSNEQFFYEKPKLVAIPKAKSNSSSNVTVTVESQIPDGKSVEDRWSYITANYLADDEPQLGTKVNFFYFADLVYFLLDSLYKEEKEFFPEVENIKVVLTSFTLDLLGEGSETLINIGEIPVDLDTFIEWFKVNILDKDVEAISIIDFIKRFFLYLLKDVFQETCVNTAQEKKLSFKTMSVMAIDRDDPGTDPLNKMLQQDINSINSQNNLENSPILNVVRHYNEGNLPLITSAINRESPKTSDFINYMMLFVHYKPNKFTGLGIKDEDETKGIYHFFVGADKGLVKNINFSKSDIQYIREARMMNQGTNNLLQLSSVYRSSIKMVGNTLLFPGMELFINPFGFGGPVFGMPEDGPGDINSPNLSNIMGIGGYQQVIKVNSTISPGKFETTVDCLFIHSGEPRESNESSTGIRTVTNNKLKGLCSIDDPAIDTPQSENDIIACNDLIVDVQNALVNYSQTGTINLESEE